MSRTMERTAEKRPKKALNSWLAWLESAAAIEELGSQECRRLLKVSRKMMRQTERRCPSASWIERLWHGKEDGDGVGDESRSSPCEILVRVESEGGWGVACAWRPGMATVRRVRDLEGRDCPHYPTERYAAISWPVDVLVPSICVQLNGYSVEYAIEHTELDAAWWRRQLGEE